MILDKMECRIILFFHPLGENGGHSGLLCLLGRAEMTAEMTAMRGEGERWARRVVMLAPEDGEVSGNDGEADSDGRR